MTEVNNRKGFNPLSALLVLLVFALMLPGWHYIKNMTPQVSSSQPLSIDLGNTYTPWLDNAQFTVGVADTTTYTNVSVQGLPDLANCNQLPQIQKLTNSKTFALKD